MRKKIMCCLMVLVLCVGTLQPKEAHAVAIADDAVVIICCLLAAAGITFATSDGVTDAVSDFLDQSGGKFDSLLSQLASNRVVRAGHEVIMLPMELASQVRGLLRGLYDYFTVGDDRTGSVEKPSGKNVFYTSDASYAQLYTFATSEEFFTYEFAFHMNPKYVAENRCLPIYYCHIEKTGDSVFRVSCDNYSSPEWGNKVSSSDNYSATGMRLFYRNDTTYKSGLCMVLRRPSGSELQVSLFSWLLTSAYFSRDLCNTAIAYITDNLGNVIINDKYVSSVSVPEIGTTSLPYGLTFPEELTYEDVLDRFEERLEAAAGDLAIALPQSGVVDNTLTYQEAQEQVLVNVNELGEVTDTTTETNTWLQKLLVSVKAIPATVIGTGSLDFDAFKGLSLTSVFPFCIPFDLKNALLSFNAVPADPVWSIDFAGTFMEPAGSLEIDMTEFESLFKIVRFFIYGGFVVSLILLTRKIIKG